MVLLSSLGSGFCFSFPNGWIRIQSKTVGTVAPFPEGVQLIAAGRYSPVQGLHDCTAPSHAHSSTSYSTPCHTSLLILLVLVIGPGLPPARCNKILNIHKLSTMERLYRL